MTKILQNAGSYRHPIIIQKLDQTRNEYGELSDVWLDHVQTRAGIYPMSGRQIIAAQSINSEVTHQLHTRYVSGIQPEMRVQHNGRYFIILSVINFQEMNKELQLLCKEFVT